MLKLSNAVLEEAKKGVWISMEELGALSDELKPFLLWKGEESPRLHKAYVTLELAHKQIQKALDVYKYLQKGIEGEKHAASPVTRKERRKGERDDKKHPKK